MNFSLTEEQLQLKGAAKKFADEVREVAKKWDSQINPEECIPWDLIEKGNKLGFTKASIPSQYGGNDISTLDKLCIVEELAWGDAGLTATIMSSTHFVHVLAKFGTDEQKEYWFKKIIEDKTNKFITAGAFTEPNAGSDVMSPNPQAGIKTTAELKGDKWILNGTKSFITNGGLASIYLICARTDMEKGGPQGGLSLFIVPKDTPGLKIGKVEDKVGQRLSQQTEIVLEECEIPKENILGQPGMGFPITLDLVASTFTGVGIIGVGIARAAYEIAYQYAKERVQGGCPIVQHQAVSHKLADMLCKIESVRTLAHKSAWQIDNGKPNNLTAMMCKIMGAELATSATDDAMQILGGYGYSKEYLIEKLWRDARVLPIYEGTTETQKSNVMNFVVMMEQMMAGKQ